MVTFGPLLTEEQVHAVSALCVDQPAAHQPRWLCAGDPNARTTRSDAARGQTTTDSPEEMVARFADAAAEQEADSKKAEAQRKQRKAIRRPQLPHHKYPCFPHHCFPQPTPRRRARPRFPHHPGVPWNTGCSSGLLGLPPVPPWCGKRGVELCRRSLARPDGRRRGLQPG